MVAVFLPSEIMNVDPATVSFQDHRGVLGNMDVQDTDGEWIKVQGKKKKETTSTVKVTWTDKLLCIHS